MSQERRQDLLYPPGPHPEQERDEDKHPSQPVPTPSQRLHFQLWPIRGNEAALEAALRRLSPLDRFTARMVLSDLFGGHYFGGNDRAVKLCERIWGPGSVDYPIEREWKEEQQRKAERRPMPPVATLAEAQAAYRKGRVEVLRERLAAMARDEAVPSRPELLALLWGMEDGVARAALVGLVAMPVPAEQRGTRDLYDAFSARFDAEATYFATTPVGRERLVPLPGADLPRPETRVLSQVGGHGGGLLLGSWDEAASQEERAQREALCQQVWSESPAALKLLGQGGGEPLPEVLRVRMERLLGHDFAAVRIHTDGAAAEAVRLLGARALALGHHLYFDAGEWVPGTTRGDRLLVHELVHVVQFDEGRLPGGRGAGLEVSQPEDGVEREAEARAQNAMSFQSTGQPDVHTAKTASARIAGVPGEALGAAVAPVGRLTTPSASRPAAFVARKARADGKEGPAVAAPHADAATTSMSRAEPGVSSTADGSAGPAHDGADAPSGDSSSPAVPVPDNDREPSAVSASAAAENPVSPAEDGGGGTRALPELHPANLPRGGAATDEARGEIEEAVGGAVSEGLAQLQATTRLGLDEIHRSAVAEQQKLDTAATWAEASVGQAFTRVRGSVTQSIRQARRQMAAAARSKRQRLGAWHAQARQRARQVYTTGQERTRRLGEAKGNEAVSAADRAAQEARGRIEGDAEKARQTGAAKAQAARGGSQEIVEARRVAARGVADDTAKEITKSLQDTVRELRGLGPETRAQFIQQANQFAAQLARQLPTILDQLDQTQKDAAGALDTGTAAGLHNLAELERSLAQGLGALERAVRANLRKGVAGSRKSLGAAAGQAAETVRAQHDAVAQAGADMVATILAAAPNRRIRRAAARKIAAELRQQVKTGLLTTEQKARLAMARTAQSFAQAALATFDAVRGQAQQAQEQAEALGNNATAQAQGQLEQLVKQLEQVVTGAMKSGTDRVRGAERGLDTVIADLDGRFSKAIVDFQAQLQKKVTEAAERAREPLQTLDSRIEQGMARAEAKLHQSWLERQWSNLVESINWGMLAGLLVGILVTIAVVALLGTGIGALIVAGALAGALSVAATTLTNDAIAGRETNWGELGKNMLIGAAFGAIGGVLGGGVTGALGKGVVQGLVTEATSVALGKAANVGTGVVLGIVQNVIQGDPWDKNLLFNVVQGVALTYGPLAKGIEGAAERTRAGAVDRGVARNVTEAEASAAAVRRGTSGSEGAEGTAPPSGVGEPSGEPRAGQRGETASAQFAENMGGFKHSDTESQMPKRSGTDADMKATGTERPAAPNETPPQGDTGRAPIALTGDDPRLAEAVSRIPPAEGRIDVVVHGAGGTFFIRREGRLVPVDHRMLARYIEASGGAGRDIRLISCGTGGTPSSVAQHLANKLGVNVTAPEGTIWIHPDGSVTIGPRPTVDSGKWHTYEPGVNPNNSGTMRPRDGRVGDGEGASTTGKPIEPQPERDGRGAVPVGNTKTGVDEIDNMLISEFQQQVKAAHAAQVDFGNLRHDTPLIYAIYAADGTPLKVGKSAVGAWKGRSQDYQRAASKLPGGEGIYIDIFPIQAEKGIRAQYYEGLLRAKLDGGPQTLPWDNTGRRLVREGPGTPFVMPSQFKETHMWTEDGLFVQKDGADPPIYERASAAPKPDAIINAIRQANGDLDAAAALLGLSTTDRLRNLMNKHEIRKGDLGYSGRGIRPQTGTEEEP